MTTIAQHAARTTDQVRAEASELRPAKVLLTVLFVIPWVLGWLVGAVWTCFAWAWTAAVVGYRTAQGGASDERPPS